jgi:pimeloyl-ACP methyl ester carboxylesterase
VFFIDSNGVRLHCATLGNSATLGSGPTLVFCHGLVFGSMASWYFSIAAKLAQRYRVVLYDMRGHGKSEIATAGYDLDTLANDLAAVIEHTVPRGEDITLIGHSYGALVALRYALKRKRYLRDLILVDAPLPASRYVYPSLADITSVDMLETQLSLSHLSSANVHSRRKDRVRERLETLFLKSSLRADIATSGDISDTELRRFDTSTLCIYGRDSDCAQVGRRLEKILPYAQLSWLDCGHYIIEEAPQQLLQTIESYLLKRQRPFVERKQLVANGEIFFERRTLKMDGSSGHK